MAAQVEVGKYYWIRLYRDDAQWQPAQRVGNNDPRNPDEWWLVIGEEVDYYDTEVNEVGPEIVAPPQ